MPKGPAQLLIHCGTHTPTTRGAWVAVGWRVEVHFGAGGQATDEAGAIASRSLSCACCYPLTKRILWWGAEHPCLLTQLCGPPPQPPVSQPQHQPACEGGEGRGGTRLWTWVLDWWPWEDCLASSLGKSCSEGCSVMGHFLQALSAPSASGGWVMVLHSVP